MRNLLIALTLGLVSCQKVPIIDVAAGFVLADASWFAEEETLFVFYEVEAEQGLGNPSVIEITYATDDERVDWTPVSQFETVHTHLRVDCGVNAMCGSTSIRVPIEPRDVDVRLRYHRDGELALDASTVFNVVGPGPPHTNRSLLVYGVFDERNQRIQWRARHQFPTLRNKRAERLGLRRRFTISDQRYGDGPLGTRFNPYSYGVNCPSDVFDEVGFEPLVTTDRARFNLEDLPLDASDVGSVCARSTVTDATEHGTFTTGAVARKNPEIRAAFPVLRSPIAEAKRIDFFLAPCNTTISEDHREMQLQRLLMDETDILCIDDWQDRTFVDEMVVLLRKAIEDQRVAGHDMVLVLGLHQEDEDVADVLEDILVQIVPDERDKTSPRLVGAFVYDSDGYSVTRNRLSRSVLWCPADIAFDQIPTASVRSCALVPDLPELELGPFTFGALPILPSRPQYLDFIDTFSKGQAGEMTDLTFLAPRFATTADHVDFGDFGVITFLNGETFGADADDAFSYCRPDVVDPIVVRSPLMEDPAITALLELACSEGTLDPAVCAMVDQAVLPVELLPDWHNTFRETDYDVGLFWDFPYLLRLNYRASFAGSVGALGFSVPFGIASPAEEYQGSIIWQQDEFTLDPQLTQCRRFCDHPTFDGAGVYHPREDFRTTYANNCYLPDYPGPSDDGFPRDP